MMMARSVFALLAAGALTFAAPVRNASSDDIRQFAATIVTEARQLAAMASMQQLDYRTHQFQLETLRSAVNGLGLALHESAVKTGVESAREVAALLTRAIETINETQTTMLPLTYRETARKMADAAERLQREVRGAAVRSGRE